MGHPCGVASTRTILCDNGSLNPAATLRLRQLARSLSEKIGRTVDPVSVLHSDKVDAAQLGGVKAETFETYARRAKAEGIETLEVFPLFIGPSLAITEYLPERAATVGVRLAVRPTLAAAGREEAFCDLLLDNLGASGWTQGSGTVLLCDHGSPLPAVTAVREDLAARLRRRLGLSPDELLGCAMERRDGPDYAFNEPMLADAIRGASGHAVLLMLFLLPGRHAGADGDVARICAEHAPADLPWKLSPLLGDHPDLMGIHLLA